MSLSRLILGLERSVESFALSVNQSASQCFAILLPGSMTAAKSSSSPLRSPRVTSSGITEAPWSRPRRSHRSFGNTPTRAFGTNSTWRPSLRSCETARLTDSKRRLLTKMFDLPPKWLRIPFWPAHRCKENFSELRSRSSVTRHRLLFVRFRPTVSDCRIRPFD